MSRKSNPIPFEITDQFVIDPMSPSGLSWKNPSKQIKSHRAEYKQGAGSLNNKTGYWQVKVNGKKYGRKNFFIYVHRIIWMLVNQREIPDGFVVDHINNDKVNDPKNLRLASNSQNIINAPRKPRKSGLPNRVGHNSAGYFGCFNYEKKKYRSATFKSLADAENWLSVKLAEVHGEFLYKAV